MRLLGMTEEDEEHPQTAIEMDDESRQAIQQDLIRHRAILEEARQSSIDDAYAELLKPSPFSFLQKLLLKSVMRS